MDTSQGDEGDVNAPVVKLLQLPEPVLVTVLDCLGDAAAVARAATACQALYKVASSARFRKVTTVRFSCCHPELQQALPRLVQQFPNITQLDVSNCSTLPGSRMQLLAVWPVQKLNVTHLWHWDGSQGACLLAWAPTLTHMTADGTSLPIAAAAISAAAAAGAVPAASDTPGGEAVAAAAAAAAGAASTGIASSAAQRSPEQQQQGARHLRGSGSSAEWVSRTGQLLQLQLRRLLVDNPIRCRLHGSSDCQCSDDTVLSELLSHNPHLTSLDLSDNPMLPDRLLRWALTGSCAALHALSLRGCELLRPGYIGSCCPGLLDLDLAGTASEDTDVACLVGGLRQLTQLSLNGCRKVSSVGVESLAASDGILSGRLRSVDLGRLTRTTPAALTSLARSWCSRTGISAAGRANAPVLLQVGLSHAAGVTDGMLESIARYAAADGSHSSMRCCAAVAAGAAADVVLEAHMRHSLKLEHSTVQTCRVQLTGLGLAGCSSVSGFALQQLARLGLLSGLTRLDLSDVEALRQPSGSWNVGANVVAVTGMNAGLGPGGQAQQQQQQQQEMQASQAAGAAAVEGFAAEAATAPTALPASVLAHVFVYTGSQLTFLALDGCHIDDDTAAFIGARCTRLQQLSLVGCRGLQSAGLQAMLQACSSSSTRGSSGSLRSLQLGGSHSRWREGEALTGVSGLTGLRLLRRSNVRDAELTPVLSANPGLRSLALVGCYSLTDDLFAPAAAPGVSRDAPQLWQHVTQLVLTACDSITGSSISNLRGLRHLRVSFCASFSKQSVQQIVLSCKKLVLLELPAQLQRQLSAHAAAGTVAASTGREGAAAAAGALVGRNSRRRGSQAGSGCATGGGLPSRPSVRPSLSSSLPQQGAGGHLHGLKVVCT